MANAEYKTNEENVLLPFNSSQFILASDALSTLPSTSYASISLGEFNTQISESPKTRCLTPQYASFVLKDSPTFESSNIDNNNSETQTYFQQLLSVIFLTNIKFIS